MKGQRGSTARGAMPRAAASSHPGRAGRGLGHPGPKPRSHPPLPLALLTASQESHVPAPLPAAKAQGKPPRLRQFCTPTAPCHQRTGPLHRDLLLPAVKSPVSGEELQSPACKQQDQEGARNEPASSIPTQLFHSFLFSCLSYFLLFFCLGILSTPAKEKKINNREKLRAVLADCSGRFVCSNPIVPGSHRSLLPTAPSRLLTLGRRGRIALVPCGGERRTLPPPSRTLMFQSEHLAGAWQAGREGKKKK